MNEYEVVKDIIQKEYKSGTSDSGKKWSLHLYSTNSDKQFTSFDDLEAGDTVILRYNSQYNNYSGGKPRKSDTQHDELMEALRKQYKLSLALYKVASGEDYKESAPAAKPTGGGFKSFQEKGKELKAKEEKPADDEYYDSMFPDEE